MTMMMKIQKTFALSEQGAKDLIKGCAACALHNVALIFPVWLLYALVKDLMSGGGETGRAAF